MPWGGFSRLGWFQAARGGFRQPGLVSDAKGWFQPSGVIPASLEWFQATCIGFMGRLDLFQVAWDSFRQPQVAWGGFSRPGWFQAAWAGFKQPGLVSGALCCRPLAARWLFITAC